ncbi:PREDICTED: tachykinins [Dufourea novaeangliae]|uniref:tachykinins n=1 Tax=Dufourea novaeangliae TaxID=178035 RepID=UPI000766E2DE|nr:PREDICTED: tachykinins [Dufourea novaeangliae]
MIVRSSLLLAATIVFTFADDSSSNSLLSEKRGPMGFQGMRGKKDFASLEHDQLSKRTPMGFQGMRGKKDSITGEIQHELLSEDANKRAPMGFHGLRGKKDSTSPYFDDSYVPVPGNMYEKRSRYKQDEHYKRAPMGFQGMRGKKSLQEISNEIEKQTGTELEDSKGAETYSFDYSEDYETRVPATGYQQGVLRDKKNNEIVVGEWEKRAPMGFQGMRGKKIILDAIQELEKRAAMGFHGMRGKKDTFVNYADYPIGPFGYAKRSAEDFDEGEVSESFKRARMGFHGMRGKRDATRIYGSNAGIGRTTIGHQGTNDRGNQVVAYEIEKRSPLRYLGVRGKKNPRWELRGKFVGVRGKKSSSVQDRLVF